ncbi:YhgE/Pip domain-containing protein [Haloimpatiens lingqiaonensis]|uniref:YhgE/Pip domain-containing protein n=1 Tax=Haloimpatiens lingqiaonensis TaxID=1380675 RepID=UPI0010FD0EE5|nr:YhgE/Pip domain-containing protein [Haloimpatiens lingqiaonensis]
MKIGNKEISKKTTYTVIAISVIAIMFVPMLYSAIYLKAFWDPYGNLQNVPVAFVNLDKPVTKDGKKYNIGEEVEDNLKENKKVKWQFVNYDEANEGINGAKYYAMIVIPEDFSRKVADAADGKFQKPEIIYTPNKGTNFIFSQVSSKAAEAIKSEITSNMAKETTKELAKNLYEVKDSIKDASEGSKKLKDGLLELSDGGNKLLDGQSKVVDGLNVFKGKLSQTDPRIAELISGAQTVNGGAKQVSEGLGVLNGKMPQLTEGVNKINGGLVALNTNIPQISNGTSQISGGLSELNKQMPSLQSGAKKLNDGIKQVKYKVSVDSEDISKKLNGAGDGVEAVSKNINIAYDLMAQAQQDMANGKVDEAKVNLAKSKYILEAVKSKDISTNIAKPLKENADALKPLVGVLGQLEEGSTSMLAGTNKVGGAVNQLSIGATKLSNGVGQVSWALNELSNGSNELLDGQNKATEAVNKLFNGSVQVTDGTNKVAMGNVQLAKGIDEKQKQGIDGVNQLLDGSNKLKEGTSTLNSGLKEASNGGKELNDGLSEGYDKMDEKLKFTPENISEFISEPVNLHEKPINDVKYYGEGLAPYFMSLSLWLGAMFVNIIITLAKFSEVVKNKFLRSFTGKAIIGSVLVAIQAVILSATLAKGLGMHSINNSYFYLNNIFVAIVFFMIMYGLSYAMGGVATPIIFVALLLQLSSCAGTFPIETAPKFYQAIGKVLPMTYSVKMMRMIVSGMNNVLFKENVVVMIKFILVFVVFGFLIGRIFTPRVKIMENK